MRKIFFIIVMAFFTVTAGLVQAVDYRPSAPVMDYVPQNIGIYDTYYQSFFAVDCRGCHGFSEEEPRDGGGYRHQFTASAFNPCPSGQPLLTFPTCALACHSDLVYPENIITDCRQCHMDTGIAGGQPHHKTDLANSGQCTACHQPDLLTESRSILPPSYYPTAATNTPTPFSCENCHWPSGNFPHHPPNDWPYPIEANGPMTTGVLNAYNAITNPLGKHYKPADGTHHQIDGLVYAKCDFCHANAPGHINYDPESPILIRYCENCHDVKTLHGIQEHMIANNIYTVGGNVDMPVTADQKCEACHGSVPVGAPPSRVIKPPVIKNIDPMFGDAGTECTISGENFGSAGSVLLTPRMGDTGNTRKVPSSNCTWSISAITFTIPDDLSPGNYNIRVNTADGISNIISNMKVFTVIGDPVPIPCPTLVPSITIIEPPLGADNPLVTIHGQDFCDRHTYNRNVLVNSTVLAIIHSWTDNEIKFRIPPSVSIGNNIPIAVKTENGVSTPVDFELRKHPYISSLSPTNIQAGDSLTIYGEGFGESQEGSKSFDGGITYYGWTSQVKLSHLLANGSEDTITVNPSNNINKWVSDGSEIDLTVPDVPDDDYGVTVGTKYFKDDNPQNGHYDYGETLYQNEINDPRSDPSLLTIGLKKGLGLNTPNGGETIPSGSAYTIRWSAPPEAVKFTLKYSINNGSTWKTIAKNVTGTSYNWTVPCPNNNKTKSLVKVTGYNSFGTVVGQDTSNSTFTIEVVKILSPNGGEPLESGKTWNITWRTNGTINPVAKSYLYYTTGGGVWKLIAIRNDNYGSYLWGVPWVSSKKCKVKVVLKDASSRIVGSDVSDKVFTITPVPIPLP